MCCFADARSVRVFILDWRCFGISKVQHQLNEEITDKEIRLIGENGEQLGIVSGEEALRTAEEQGLDLVKISPQATPPVCKLMNYGKYKFEQSKREKEARKNQHVVEIKEIRMSPGIDVGDFNTKLKNAQKFLSDGNRVKVSVRFRGREMAHTEIGRDLLNKFAELCTEVSTLDKAAKLEGRICLFSCPPRSANKHFIRKGSYWKEKTTMPKLKTHSGAKKRFNLTKTGKVKRAHAFKSHILTKKDTKRGRRLRSTTYAD